MTDTKLSSIEELKTFLRASPGLEFKAQIRGEKYEWVKETLGKFKYLKLRKKHRGLVRSYLMKMTGYSPSQITRLANKYSRNELKAGTKYQRHKFPKKYSDEEITLLALADNYHSRLNGHAIKRILEREYEIFNKSEFENIKNISVAHIYRLRKTKTYQKSECTFTKTTANKKGESIGVRRKPDPDGKPGYIRVDTVHQGDKNGKKGVYHINSVDIVTQWEVVGSVEKITERYLVPILEDMIKQYPFKILGFHADNGGEYINKVIARLLNKLLIEFTKSRPRKSNDNALVESKNGSVIRKHMGYLFIPQSSATAIHEFYQNYLNDYLNFHRPCGFARDEQDKKGKIRKIYDSYLTPLEKLKTLDNPSKYLKPRLTMDQLKEKSLAYSDTEFAKIMEKEKLKLFKRIGFVF
jgi:hypothetical protein